MRPVNGVGVELVIQDHAGGEGREEIVEVVVDEGTENDRHVAENAVGTDSNSSANSIPEVK